MALDTFFGSAFVNTAIIAVFLLLLAGLF